MGQQYQETKVIPFYSTNATSEINISALFNEMLLVSEHQLHAVGIDSQQMVAQGIGWVVTKYHLEIARLPRINEKVTIVTEANSYNKFFCYRTFTLYDSQGQQLLHLLSNWVMMDIKKRSMIEVIPETMAKIGCEYSTDIWRFPRIQRFKYSQSPQIYRTRFFDIDVNGHVNNSIYLDWMLDSLGKDFLMQHQLQTLDIKYDREVAYGQSVQSFVQLEDNLISHHQILTDNKVNAQAQMQWQQRQK
ncbi:acyl-ACP thioesterase [Lactobacillus mellis]|uniref:acyl-[acyl-carrier-protein] thioesterase n=1 Tax=Bombilactobacillus mellis TaxID=1218508 RepID=UPI001580B48F|nr:acyl-ACP thioesterase domain-containing protein [Bombilactobacillus mellis]NUG66778.1 acyl-ACP thioesterase [Bombilactobacillus mellis]